MELGELGGERLREVLERLPDACTLSRAVRGPDGRAQDMTLLWMNARARAGQPDPAGAIGRTCRELWPQMVDNGSFAACMRVLDGGVDEHGEFRWTEAATYTASYYEWHARRVGADLLLWTLRDGQGLLERTLASEARLRAIFEAAPDPIVVSDEGGAIVSANPAVEALLGWAPAELVGQNVRILMPPSEAAHHDGFIDAYLRTGERRIIGIGRDVMARRRDGSLVEVRLSIGEARVAEGRLFTAMLQDLTARRALEAQLRHVQKLEVVGRLVGSVAHDFNNLLTVIRASSALIIDGDPGEAPRDSAQMIADAADRAASLTRRLLSFSRRDIEAPSAIEIEPFVRRLAEMATRLLGGAHWLELEIEAADAPVVIDGCSLEQALLNLIVNARDALPEGGSIRLSVARTAPSSEEAAPPGDWVWLGVRDAGTGMSPEIRARAFEPFFTTKAPERGTGLGLPTVRDIAVRAGGDVVITSAPGRGTTVVLRLPVARHAAAPERVAPAGRQRGRETLLLVDDEPFIRRALARALTARGFTVVTAASGEAAVREHAAAVAAGAIHVLITDVMLPGLTGPAVAEALRAQRPDLPVLFVSGYVPEEVLSTRSLPPRSALLSKPFDGEHLAGAVRALLADVAAG